MPLPTQEEVLICNENTTAEEVLQHFYIIVYASVLGNFVVAQGYF